ncbi:unnamed protein product [Caenorhabditis bovis]|uniref:DNA mismatch repair proteins mutS family domain-containing protein n=1 Tax=Caenorhabditis bovis TaxID=2654633 RepID=A0A8S1FD97_9PELO|nr:unnamed protein product [Caenorhabditis bovis]
MAAKWRYYNVKRGGNFFQGRRKRGSFLSNFIPRNSIQERNNQEDRVELNEKDYRDETVLSISYGMNLLGAAVYEQSTQYLRVMHDISEDDQFEYVFKLIETVNPTIILISSNVDLKLQRILSDKYGGRIDEKGNTEFIPRWNPKTNEESDEGNNETTMQNDEESDSEVEYEGDKVKLVKMGSNLYRFDKCMNRISELINAEDPSISSEEQKLIVKSLGAILFYLDDSRLGVENAPLNVRVPVKAIKTFVLESMVEMDLNSFRALDILPLGKEAKARGAVSLFDLCNKCKSTIGKKCLKKWFRNPTSSKSVLKSRQRCIHFFIQDCHMDVTAKILRLLGKVKSLEHIFKRFKNGSATLIHWESFTKTVAALTEIIEIIQETQLKSELLDDDIELKDISEAVVIARSIIDFDESRNEGRITISTGVDELLDEYKISFQALPSILTTIAEQEAIRLNLPDQDACSCIYVPIVGYLLSLPGSFPLNEHPEMTMVYQTDSEIRVKNEMTAKLDEEIGDIRMQIIDKETVIILRLKKMIMIRRRKILQCQKVAAQLDALISLAIVAGEYNWKCPYIADEPVIEATELVHPLVVSTSKKTFVPNKFISGLPNAKVSILTGPNACGKSVYMKQVGILVFLAHIGSFVPARTARIGPVDRIVTRMFTVDNVLDGMSTFAKDVEQVAKALRKSSINSLIIIDEFGKGTMTEVGLSLLASCLTHWINSGPERCPHVIVSSHFHAVFKYIPIESSLLTFLTFQVNRLPGGRLDYLFKLVEGHVDCSFAMMIAKDEGIPLGVVARACAIYGELKNGKGLSEVKTNIDSTEDDEACKNMEELTSTPASSTFIEKVIPRYQEDDLDFFASERNFTQTPRDRKLSTFSTEVVQPYSDLFKTPMHSNKTPEKRILSSIVSKSKTNSQIEKDMHLFSSHSEITPTKRYFTPASATKSELHYKDEGTDLFKTPQYLSQSSKNKRFSFSGASPQSASQSRTPTSEIIDFFKSPTTKTSFTPRNGMSKRPSFSIDEGPSENYHEVRSPIIRTSSSNSLKRSAEKKNSRIKCSQETSFGFSPMDVEERNESFKESSPNSTLFENSMFASPCSNQSRLSDFFGSPPENHGSSAFEATGKFQFNPNEEFNIEMGTTSAETYNFDIITTSGEDVDKSLRIDAQSASFFENNEEINDYNLTQKLLEAKSSQ